MRELSVCRVYLSLGSNINREQHISAALNALDALFSPLIVSDAYKQIEGIRNVQANIVYINPDPNMFYNLSANFILHLDKLFPKLKLPSSSLSIYAKNILDYKQWQPDMHSHTIKSLPGMPGRNINVNLKLQF